MVVCGTRPEIIKLYPLILELRSRPAWDVVVCHTGQHRTMANLHFDEFGLHPDIDLRIMRPGQTLPYVTARVIDRLEAVLAAGRPHVVIVQGDTTSGMAAALCAFGMQIPVVHVEAGLRSGVLYGPFPEEANRRIISSVAALHFAPTEAARQNVLREYPSARVFVVGNTGLDALRMVSPPRAGESRYEPSPEHPVLVTMHRRERLAERVTSVCTAIRELVDNSADLVFHVPLHPNPEVRRPAVRLLKKVPRVSLGDPMPYRQMISALHDAWLVMTDSGGLQEEAAFLGRPALVLRNCTDRPEAVTEGVCAVIGTDPDTIVRSVQRLQSDRAYYASMCRPTNVFGDGNSRHRIADLIERELVGRDITGI